ncbi:hypothetical protein EDC04DRAFT_2613445 [Pisolithus marmoratus]|nr:hypothetical protein EDC04DRAFT_2613445 [Pisolithus marmoratus]
MAEEPLPPASISCQELKLTALVISHAILNLFSEPMKNVIDKTKYFPHPQWGHISDPATILDVHGRVLVWYLPGIIPPARVEHLNEIHIPLKDSLVQCSKTRCPSKRKFGHKHVPEEEGNEKFGHGRLMNSPATFQQAHMRLEDQVYESSSLKEPAVRQWLRDITYAEDFWNTIAEISCLILPKLARRLSLPGSTGWPSIYLGIDVIVNQETPPHQDQASAPSLLDLVPGTMVFLAGKLLTHSVPKWEKGERIALAHYMKDAIHNRFGLARPMFTMQKDLLGQWLPWRAEYLNVILEGEQLAKAGICDQCEEAEGSVQGMSCTGVHAWCGPCAVKAHRNLPFHKVQRWNGTHYEPTSLMELGFLWHIGHGGDPFPQNSSDPDPDESGYMTGEEPPNHRHSDDLAIRRSSQFQMTIVHTEGIFSHEVSVGNCPGSHPNDWHLDLLRQRLFPASISKPKTAFTFAVLDHFLIDALECKTSAMSFYQKLKRFTNNAFPERDRYRELMRVSQLWRDLKDRKSFGFGHDMEQDPGDGGLALFCPACPQPGVNLPADWKVCYDRDTIMRQYVIDGNFTAQHMKMNKPELDVALSDGKGYMVAEVPYQSHLKQSLDSKERSTCSNHRAINAANINKSNLQSTGIGATACAQHGCFVPHSVVDFQKGEREHHKSLVIYDVGCQWSINFRSRVKNSPSLLLPPALEIVPAVGKFHLAAHKLSCFPRYSLNFIKGAGHLDREILETLWAPFNKISPTARSMTQAHRQEVYDDHMRDSNWKKLVGMGKFSFFLEGMWESDALRAEADRGEALDIYLLKGDKAPTFQEVWLQLMTNPKSPSGNVGSVAWLAEGISIEDSQMILHSDDDDEGDWETPEEEVEGLASELMSIWMPSAIGAAKLTELGLHDLLTEERELRIGQTNDCLDQLRTDLGNKAMTANSTREGTRTKKEIQKVVARVTKHVRSYQRARQAILRLDPDGNMAEKYQEILPEDLAVSKEVTEENRFGQGTSKLAWFWVIDGEKSQLNVEAGGLMEEFYRINWLKARARRDRWKEVSLVRHEMLWTGLWFEYHKKMWEQRALQSTEPGKEAYANKQMGLWSDFASKARLMFHGLGGGTGVNGKYVQTKWAMPKSGMADILSTTCLNKKSTLKSFPPMWEGTKKPRGNSQLRNEILAEVKSEILKHEPEDSVGLPPHLRVTHLRKSWAESCEGEDAREEKAHPTKAGDYKKAFMAFTAVQRIFKEEMDVYDRERRDTKDPKTIGQRNRIIQQWWESVSDERKAEAGRAVEKWNKLAHEAGEGQIKMAVFETAPADGKKAFTQFSESSKDWVLNGENSLTDYLLTAPVEDDSAEKHEVEISLDEDGNPEMPTWVGQRLKVQQNLARAVFQAAYVWGIAKFMKNPKARVPWGLLIESPMEYLDSHSIPEGFMMKDPSKWTKADLQLFWNHWQTLEAEEKVIVSFISCKKEDAPLSRQFDRRPVVGSSKKREWMDPEDDSEEEVGEEGVHLGQMMKSGEVVNKGWKQLWMCRTRPLKSVALHGMLARTASNI